MYIIKEKALAIHALGKPEETFEDFAKHFPEEEPRYGIFDLEVKYPDGHTSSKICFYMYCPDKCPKMMVRMQYSACKDWVKGQFSAIAKEFQVNDKANLTLAKALEEFLGKN